MIILFIFCIFCNVLFAYSDKALSSRNLRNETPKSIIDDSLCTEVRTICQNLSDNDDVLILECLLSTNPERLERVNKDCQNVIWNHIRKLIEDKTVNEILSPICGNELTQINCKLDNKGNFLKCLVNSIKEIHNTECSQAVFRLENVAFTDHYFTSSFFEHCTDDINILGCGLIDVQSLSQVKTVSCLQDHILRVRNECKTEVFRLFEFESNSIKLDAELYVDCAEDQIRYCPRFIAVSARVLPCLMYNMNLDPTKISVKCRRKLIHRQKLIMQDYRVSSKGLLRACKEDIKRTHCRKQISSDKTVRLAQILLCLENIIKNGTKVDQGCEVEMTDHRRMLMEDYRLSPEIVNDCKNETTLFCRGFELGGKTIHCLMSHALNKANSLSSRLGDKCLRALEDLVRQTDAGENWSVDPVLQQACSAAVKEACRGIKGGDSRIMSCLMDNLRSDAMTEDCENALIEIQYFIARDFKLDPQLYRACKLDASRYCHSFESRESEQGPSYGPQVLSCLYRQAYQENSPIQKGCHQQIQRVMRQRAISVDLHPEIEEACLRDLGAYCQDKSKKGEEIQCLQDNLDDLDDDCHKAVESYTEIEAEDIQLNPFIMKYCSKIIDTLCNSNSINHDGYVMDCLIENKNNIVVKSEPSCRASIEHFQIISLKDYRFTYKFKVACKLHAMRLCGQASSKSEMIACLSEHILNSTVQGLKSTIPKECRQQLKSQIFQQREKIDYNPALKKVCLQDINKFCANVQSGNSRVLECLQAVSHSQLSSKCSKEVFKVQKLEIYDNSVDYALITMCAETIDQFCPHHEKETIFNCLKVNKDEKGFNKKCRLIVMHRLAEQNSNNLLNPSLQRNCHSDIAKSCKHKLLTNLEKDVEDSVIKCLKTQFKLAKLTDTCEKEIADILREQALDVSLNPLIRVVCKNELETICKFDGEDSGKAEECLKSEFINKNIPTPECRLEVANMIEESQADIQVDPLLQRACALDLLTYCGNIEEGNGRHIQCLKTVMKSKTQTLSPNCHKKLKERLEMYINAPKLIVPAGLQDLYKEVNNSPSRSYFFIIFLTLFGTIFFFGLFCGRMSRTKRSLLKNK